MLMHNNANGSFTEFCQAHDTVFGGITAVQYLISDVTSHVSFHGSGLLRAAIQGSRKCVRHYSMACCRRRLRRLRLGLRRRRRRSE